MGKILPIILATLVICTIAFTVTIFALKLTQESINIADEIKIKNFKILSQSYTDSTGILTIDLQDIGGSLDSLKKENFTWKMNGNVGTAYSVDKRGDIIIITLNIGKNASGAKVTLTFKGGHQNVITVP